MLCENARETERGCLSSRDRPPTNDDDYADGGLAVIINEGHPDTDRDPVALIYVLEFGGDRAKREREREEGSDSNQW